ncbi:MAG: PLP-dependent aspartate aminotransferase family protein [Acidobacteriota bacterium]
MSAADEATRRSWHLDTRAARAGKDAEPAAGRPTATPIVPSSGFEQENAAAIDEVFEGGRGYVYSRYANPTVDVLEQVVADLEGAAVSLAYSAGMAAIASAFEALQPASGARIVASRDLYGSTITWLDAEAARRGWTVEYVEARPDIVTSELLAGAAALYCETLSNPLVRLVDLDRISAACAAAGVPLIVDATFTPPPLIRCLEHGVTLVLHSATKYLGGHGDVVAGMLSGPADLMATARAHRTLAGTIADPFSAWLLLRGIKTLSLRVERQCANAARIAAWLAERAGVSRVHYPGVSPRDGADERAALDRLFPHGRYGAMLAFEIAAAGDVQTRRFVDGLRLWGTATTLGDLDSLVLIPAMTSHRRLGEERRAALGITPGTVRLSVGVEHVDDLIADLDQALAAAG